MKPKRQYYFLIDKVYDMKNLDAAWQEVKKNKGSGGVDGMSIEAFQKQDWIRLWEIQRLLQENRYEPDPV